MGHTRGRLTVQSCLLDCDARGLPHLASPLMTRAVSGGSRSLRVLPVLPPTTPSLATAAPASDPAACTGQPGELQLQQQRPALDCAHKRPLPASDSAQLPVAKRPAGANGVWRSPAAATAAAAVGPGVLCVSETRIKVRRCRRCCAVMGRLWEGTPGALAQWRRSASVPRSPRGVSLAPCAVSPLPAGPGPSCGVARQRPAVLGACHLRQRARADVARGGLGGGGGAPQPLRLPQQEQQQQQSSAADGGHRSTV